jgi:DNA helicase HerA-like ATPase
MHSRSAHTAAHAVRESRRDAGATDNDNAGDLTAALPTDALDDRIAIVGTAGSGKTYATKGFVERLLDTGARVAIVDPLGVWWGLRASADSSAAGYPVVVLAANMPTCRSSPRWAARSAD